jgi:hypothetical protein
MEAFPIQTFFQIAANVCRMPPISLLEKVEQYRVNSRERPVSVSLGYNAANIYLARTLGNHPDSSVSYR